MKNQSDSYYEEKDLLWRYLNYFKDVRINWLDNLPSEKLHTSDDNYYIHKCRGNCYVWISSRIMSLIQKWYIKDLEVIKKGEEFIDFVKNKDFTEFSTKEDLKKIDNILDYLISWL